MATEFSTDVAILMPKLEDTAESQQRFSERYAGLIRELGHYEIEACFVQAHSSFDARTQNFADPFDITHQKQADRVNSTLVRDLTMNLKPQPLYNYPAITVVSHPEANRFIADKSNLFAALPELHPASMVITEVGLQQAYDKLPGRRIIVKPVTGQRSRGIRVLTKSSTVALEPGTYLASEFLDTSGGMPEHGIYGVHNLRFISIGGQVIGGIARLKGDEDVDILQDDHYGAFVHLDDTSAAVQDGITAIHQVLSTQPGGHNSVLAFDFIRGADAKGNISDVLCEVNRRPMRISPWNLRNAKNLDMDAIRQLGDLWDKAEAEMLAGLLD